MESVLKSHHLSLHQYYRCGSKKIRALLLFSGGLDSMLAGKLLQKQGVEVIGISFSTPFFDTENARKAAANLRIKLIEKDITPKFFPVLKNPYYGYGKNMNPCIDCHILMIAEAKKAMKKIKANFMATGEVLGERPFSQNKKALKIVAKNSSIDGLLLRPLSAKLLDKTIPEIKGWIKREKLLDIQGRSRKKQMELAKKWGIKDYPTPASGCLLTDPGYSKRLKELLKNFPNVQKNDMELIKYGRIFWFNKTLVIIGRHQNDNQMIKKLSKSNDILMEARGHKGPLTLIRDYSRLRPSASTGKRDQISDSVIKKAASMTAWYGKGRTEQKITITYSSGNKYKEIKVKPKL